MKGTTLLLCCLVAAGFLHACGGGGGGSINCQTGETVCGRECVDLGSDRENCGECGRECEEGEACENFQCVACTPDCENKECGDDECGGSCGDCEPGLTCVGFMCVCTPDCANKDCGDDGCGGSCGDCPTGQACDNFQCVACTPDCENKQCGDDGCGGSCGDCPGGLACVNFQCETAQCDPLDQTSCPQAGMACYIQVQPDSPDCNAVCLPAGDIQPRESCGYDPSEWCIPGFMCVIEHPGDSRCLPICDALDTDPDPDVCAGAPCVSLNVINTEYPCDPRWGICYWW